MWWLPKKYQYFPYDRHDNNYFGCRDVVQAEWDYIHKRRENQSVQTPTDSEITLEVVTPKPTSGNQFWLRLTRIFIQAQPQSQQPPPTSVAPDASTAVPEKLTGIALSGGGIRSASFCLGVLQALSYAGWLKKLDYLSTVSGGGYIGGSLSWLLHRNWKNARGEIIPYGLDRENFPYGSYPMVGMADKSKADEAKNWDVYKGRILRYLRQHARYLTPGDGINLMSLLAVMLRNTLFSLFVYGGFLVLLFVLLGPYLFQPIDNAWGYGWLNRQMDWLPDAINRGQALALMFTFAFLSSSVIYVPLTLIPMRYNTGYSVRFFYERWMGRLLTAALVLVTISVVPSIFHWIEAAGHSKPKVSTIQISGQDEQAEIAATGKFKSVEAQNTAAHTPSFSAKSGALSFSEPVAPPTGNQPSVWSLSALNTHLAALVGGLSTLLSAITSIWAFIQDGKPKKKIPSGVLVAVAAFSLIFGLLLLAYYFAILFRVHSGWSIEAAPWVTLVTHNAPLGDARFLPWIALLFLLFTAFANLNFFSIHRYYRDRLMETFMPDLPDAINVDGPLPGAPKSADATHLYDLLREADGPGQLGPYPIINANIVLVSSEIPKFRARGGDNFILSPKFCGSNATGWCETKNSPYDGMTPATAMAISGAAVHSNAGSGGEGATRNPWLSFLMGFFNIRLGYWSSNPAPDWTRLERIAAALRRPMQMPQCDGQSTLISPLRMLWHLLYSVVRCPLNAIYLVFHFLFSHSLNSTSNRPSALFPGLQELFLRKNLDENSRWVQLSDGGHFENLGLYELIRRRLKLIIVCDGTADAKYAFDDLASAMVKVRTDFGALIDFDCKDMDLLTPKKSAASNDPSTAQVCFAQQGYLLGKITYFNREQGTLLYLTTTLFETISADILAYRKTHPEFPDQPTADQFFDEKQFEAYRELGYQTVYHMMCDQKIQDAEDVKRTVGKPNISCSQS